MGLTILNSVDAARSFGENWAAELKGGEVFALYGVLGAGKTQLVKGLARGLGYTAEVTSPTFTLIHEYRGGRLPIYHLDLYRIADERAALAIGVEDYLPSDGLTVIEWPERIESLLPLGTHRWKIEVASLTERTIHQI
jgi:tRNA threonylcarbamoyladenosine biosynthesis protein TsaE